MKQLVLTIFLLTGFVFTYDAMAVHTKMPADGLALTQQLTVNDFLAVDLQNLRTAEGKKLKWHQRFVAKTMQKSLARKVAKGKLDGNATLEQAGGAGGNIHGLLSLIFSVVGLFVPYLGFAMLIAALVLGIIGLRKDNNPTMATIGLVLSAVFLLLLIILIAVAAGSFWF